ncbi:MAG: stage II sporulation protein R [Huintestinicola sp.]
MKIRLPKLSATALMAAAMTLSLFGSGVISAFTAHKHLESSIIRLHILAASDSEEDQNIKLKVRDAILSASDELFVPYSTSDEAERSLREGMDRIKEIADGVLESEGCSERASCEMERICFDRRIYDGFTVPEGCYTALRVKIGSGEGRNWWCVMYPPLCVPCAGADEEILEKYGGELTEDDLKLLTENEDFEARFFFIELIKKLFDI